MDTRNTRTEHGVQDDHTYRIEGKAILVTGASSGLGAALTKLLAASGAHVMMAELIPNKALDIAESLRGGPGRVRVVECDVSNPEAAQGAVDEIISAFGKIDVLINNAGTDFTCSIEELSRRSGTASSRPIFTVRSCFQNLRSRT